MKNIIVYSLWGDDQKYWQGAIENIKLAKKYYPSWISRFYIDENCDKNLINKIKGDNVEVILMTPSVYKHINPSERFNHSGLFWRFLPLNDSDVDVLISRDCDSRISEREANAVKNWLYSDKEFHIMRDHPYHQVPILSGMWGARNGILKNINQLIKDWENYPNKGVYQADDQDFMGQMIYPLVKDKSMEHSEFNIRYGGDIISFPTERDNYEFVGDVFDESENRHPEFWKSIKNKIG